MPPHPEKHVVADEEDEGEDDERSQPELARVSDRQVLGEARGKSLTQRTEMAWTSNDDGEAVRDASSVSAAMAESRRGRGG